MSSSLSQRKLDKNFFMASLHLLLVDALYRGYRLTSIGCPPDLPCLDTSIILRGISLKANIS